MNPALKYRHRLARASQLLTTHQIAFSATMISKIVKMRLIERT
jgi:hypothetical protein